MKIDTRLFRSILARRFFALFVVSALVPIVILAVVAYWRVSEELLKQSKFRLDHSAKSVSLSVYERLFFLQAELGSAMQIVGPAGSRSTAGSPGERLQMLFDGLVVVSADGEVSTVFGEAPVPPDLTVDQLAHMELGRALLLSLGGEAVEPPILGMLRVLDPTDPQTGVVMGVISPEYLWGTSGENVIPYGIDMCAYDDARRLLFGSLEGCRELAALVAAETVGTHKGDLDIKI